MKTDTNDKTDSGGKVETAQWQAAVDAITDYILVFDSALRIRQCNSAFAGRFGRKPDELIGAVIGELADMDLPITSCILEKAGKMQGPESGEVSIGGETFMLSVFPTVTDAEKLFVCTMKDIRELKKLRDKLYHSYRLASLGRLVSGVAHELNNPLTGILGFTELLTMRSKDESSKKELGKIYRAAERCKKIIESLLCFSRQQAPQRGLDSINDIIDRTLDLRSYWIRSANIEVVKNYSEMPFAYLDTQQMQQAVLNIIMNAEQAVTASGRNGRLEITTSYDKCSKRIGIRIADNGIGISEADIGRIFDPFFTTKAVNEGTGLGLSITYGVITEHGGTIGVESVEGEGSSFHIELPAG